MTRAWLQWANLTATGSARQHRPGGMDVASSSLMLLLLAAFSVALFHAMLPDHWMPIAVLARAERWSRRRTARVAIWTGIGHVLGSVALGAVVVVLGYGLNSIVRLEGSIVGSVLVLTGVVLLGWSLRRPHSHRHSHSPRQPPSHSPDHHHLPLHEHGAPNAKARRSRAAWLIPAGITASPDPTILPIFLAAVAVNVSNAIQVVILYALVTVGTMVGLALAGAWGGYRVRWDWLEQHANQITALVLVGLGIATWWGV